MWLPICAPSSERSALERSSSVEKSPILQAFNQGLSQDIPTAQYVHQRRAHDQLNDVMLKAHDLMAQVQAHAAAQAHGQAKSVGTGNG